MGVRKTALIGAIIATEFALAQEYPEGPFVKNALVFAPGKTIIESLRELAELPYDRLHPPRFWRPDRPDARCVVSLEESTLWCVSMMFCRCLSCNLGCRNGENDVATGLRDGDKRQEHDKSLTHHTRRNGKWIPFSIRLLPFENRSSCLAVSPE